MAMQLSRVVPWGRTRREYELMFNLTAADLQRAILGCADGPASFNAELTSAGGRVVSIDPLYEFSGDQIRARFDETIEEVLGQVRNTPERWVWSYHKNIDDLRRNREQAIRLFVADYERGRAEQRYRLGSLPNLELSDNSFELALCSHFLFLYSELFDEAFHVASVRELCRVAREVRIFPLLTLAQERSAHLGAVQSAVPQLGFKATVEKVRYELQKGGNEMLKICRL